MADAVGFPDVRWGSAETRLAKAGQWLVSTKPGSWLVRTMVPLDRWVLTRSDGRFTALGPFGSPLLLLTAKGAKTGLPRTTPLVYLLDGERILVVGSNFGQHDHPAWSTNLLANPDAEVTIGGVRSLVRAELLEGAERSEGWAKFEDAARPYQVYGTRTDRTIRVFALERRSKESNDGS
jgi:deazaflavin-dependent oxidoreductase (nitroreductase family)